ncbi:hypothetical protein DPEC_G00268640 [Dallia pectoralis]|uniref:Uncharacterized protein n=1 Tax=Dallia pectoralis TaxID=75939 RepID=A0ACC2FP32_DALPE|nr:hypothetical protein DPEC_G00268640 [Dallia pectoralis]
MPSSYADFIPQIFGLVRRVPGVRVGGPDRRILLCLERDAMLDARQARTQPGRAIIHSRRRPLKCRGFVGERWREESGELSAEEGRRRQGPAEVKRAQLIKTRFSPQLLKVTGATVR